MYKIVYIATDIDDGTPQMGTDLYDTREEWQDTLDWVDSMRGRTDIIIVDAGPA